MPWGFYLIVIGCLGLLVVPVSYFILPRYVARFVMRNRQECPEELPHRWHVPYPLPDPDRTPETTYDGLEAHPADDTITAPISGRECIAYELCVLFDAPGDARPPEWSLQEQRAVDIRLGNRLELAFDELYLESPVEEVDAPGVIGDLDDFDDPEPLEPDDRFDEIKRFLRQRGLFIADGDFHFFEARIEPGDRLDVDAYDDAIHILRHTDAPDCDELPRLPRPTWRRVTRTFALNLPGDIGSPFRLRHSTDGDCPTIEL